jgi:protein SCO1/2
MGKTQKIVTTTLWALVVAAMTGIVVTGIWTRGHAQAAAPAAVVYEKNEDYAIPTPEFSLIDQNGKPIDNKSLAGHVYICDFVFTHCAGTCPMMTSKMAGLQTLIPNKDIRFVSFSVDPEHDTPAVLSAYAKQYGADESRWTFVTGPKQQLAHTVLGYNLTAVPQDNGQVMHRQKFLLVDRAGNIRGNYNSEDDDAMKKLVADATKLAGEKP